MEMMRSWFFFLVHWCFCCGIFTGPNRKGWNDSQFDSVKESMRPSSSNGLLGGGFEYIFFAPIFCWMMPDEATWSHNKHWLTYNILSGWWFQHFLFSPLFGEDSQFDEYCSKGLVQPPTRLLFFHFNNLIHYRSTIYFPDDVLLNCKPYFLAGAVV